MRNKIKNFLQVPLLLLMSSMLFVQCDKSDAVVTADNLDEYLSKNSDFSMFKAAITQAKLETFTKGPGPFTVFAPTNAAFTAAGYTPGSIAALDSITLTALILHHFQTSANGVFTARTSFEIPEGPNAPMTSIAGYSVFSYKDKATNNIYLSGALISERDIRCSNGIIHKIDKILVPPTASISTQLAANPNYSLLVQAIAKAGLTSVYSPSTSAPATVFALTNATMTANGYDATTIAGLTGAALTTLTNILRYHVVASRNFSAAMKVGASLKTTYVNAGAPTYLTVSFASGVFVKGVSNPTAFQINPVDMVATNGVIHTVAGMLKP